MPLRATITCFFKPSATDSDMDFEDLSQTVDRRLATRDRGVVLLLLVPPEDLPRLHAFLEEMTERLGSDAVCALFLDDPDWESRLTTLNRERDLRVRFQKMILIVTSTKDQLRDALRIAPDLLTCPDIRF